MGGVAGAGSGAAESGRAWLAGSLAAKLAAATLVGAVVAGAGYEAAVNHPWTNTRETASPHTSAHVASAPSDGSGQATPAPAFQPIPVRLGNQSRAVARRAAAKGHRQRVKRGRPRQHTAAHGIVVYANFSAGRFSRRPPANNRGPGAVPRTENDSHPKVPNHCPPRQPGPRLQADTSAPPIDAEPDRRN
jgi:hypothetical protein